MSTNFTTIYTQIRAEVASLLPSAKELSNPDILNDNSDPLLSLGYGIIINESTVDNDFDNSEYLENRKVSVVLTRKIRTTENNGSALITAKLNMIEDTVTIKKDFLNLAQITIPNSIQKIDLEGDSGIFFIDDKPNFIACSINFIFGISESII